MQEEIDLQVPDIAPLPGGRASGRVPSSERRKVWVFLVAVGVSLWLSARAFAQISPGPLSRAHQAWNGPTQCTFCHRLAGGSEKFRCLECHTEIAQRLAAHRGYHAAVFNAQAGERDCARCHSEHNGENFPLIRWEPSLKGFDHSKTGYVLEGKHAGLACQQCHTVARISTAERATIKMKDLNRSFLGLSRDCLTCHQDAHRGQFGKDCARCHTFNDWKTAAHFDHSRTRFALTGAHAPVPCQKCHKPEPENPQTLRFVGIAFSRCADCHTDPHHGAFKAACESCHTTVAWKQISQIKIGAVFDHSRTRYALLGKHLNVRCDACHKGTDFNRPLAFNRCLDCHTDQHQGQFLARRDGGDCAACHTLDGFKPSTFGVREHSGTSYPLEGKHVAVACVKCHVPAGVMTVYKVKLTACKECHADVHRGQFAGAPDNSRCEACHTVHGFAPSTFTLARHNTTRFPLTGGHVATPCGECHQARKPPGSTLAVPYHFANLTCQECHADPHHGEFAARMERPGPQGKPVGCEACHSTVSWTESLQFDHSATAFPLLGAHRAVACMNCHKPPNLEVTMKNVAFKAAPKECHGCHEDPHAGQFSVAGAIPECSSCHNVEHWKPSVFDHDKRTEFALKGAHAKVACAACHKNVQMANGKPVLFYKPTPKSCAACHGPNPPKWGNGSA